MIRCRKEPGGDTEHAKQLPGVEALVAVAWRKIRARQRPGDSVQKATDAALLAVRSAAEKEAQK